MITCNKCEVQNPSDATICQNCGYTLLPGETFTDRLEHFFLGIICMGISIGMVYFLGKNPELIETSQCCLFTRIELWFIGIVAFPIIGIIAALKKTPKYKRYQMRAQRHQEIDPEQALADFSEALQLAPEKEKAEILKQRSALYTKLGREERALEDQLEYMQKDEAYQSRAAFGRIIGLDEGQMVSDARENAQKLMVASGKVAAIGYCLKCQKAVGLNEKLKCPIHPKKKPINTKLVTLDKVDETLIEVTNESMPQVAKMKKNRTILLIVLVGLVTLCCVIPMAMGLIGNSIDRFNPNETPPSQEESSMDAIPSEVTTRTLVPTATEKVLLLQPNFLKDQNMMCFKHSLEALSCLDEAGWHIYKSEHFDYPLYLPSLITQCEDGRIYLMAGRLFKLEGETLVELLDFSHGVEMLACGPGEDIWVAHYGGVSCFDGSTWTTYDASEHFGSGEYVKSVRSIAVGPQGDVWVVTSESIAKYDGVSWQVFEAGAGFVEEPTPQILAIDYLGNIWIIDGYHTLRKYDGTQWSSFQSPGGLMNGFAIDKGNNIWVGTSEGIFIFDQDLETWTVAYGEETFLDENIKALQFDGQGRLWVATGFGLYVYDGSSWLGYHMHTADIYDNDASDVFSIGNGPPLLPLVQKEPGSVRGQLVNEDGTAFTEIQVEICLHGVDMFYFGATPCANQAYHALATVNPDGSFSFSDIPAGKYTLMIQLDSNTWKNSKKFEVFPGKETNLGKINNSRD